MVYPNDANEYLPGTIQIPSSLLLTAITQTYPMMVTVSVDPVKASNTYHTGMVVRLTVPKSYGMFQANGLIGRILEINSNDFLLDLDSRPFDPFVVPSGNVDAPASIAPSGSRNLEYDNTTRLVPFQSLNDRGN